MNGKTNMQTEYATFNQRSLGNVSPAWSGIAELAMYRRNRSTLMRLSAFLRGV